MSVFIAAILFGQLTRADFSVIGNAKSLDSVKSEYIELKLKTPRVEDKEVKDWVAKTTTMIPKEDVPLFKTFVEQQANKDLYWANYKDYQILIYGQKNPSTNTIEYEETEQNQDIQNFLKNQSFDPKSKYIKVREPK